eukprot:CAMPEP_0117436886 /NCGR_PEP_ID=MMETSP0759-20121206/1237_1 /TAXON_ID=63605 /ORGANISM="Percolomonas cosmopolitus, Strain WS" /LENGTH=2352 /DNA_ID=CAMNT_0005228497 /DNA_START=38 /DNA_END=7097 /DNA_ORIENTATION=-
MVSPSLKSTTNPGHPSNFLVTSPLHKIIHLTPETIPALKSSLVQVYLYDSFNIIDLICMYSRIDVIYHIWMHEMVPLSYWSDEELDEKGVAPMAGQIQERFSDETCHRGKQMYLVEAWMRMIRWYSIESAKLDEKRRHSNEDTTLHSDSLKEVGQPYPALENYLACIKSMTTGIKNVNTKHLENGNTALHFAAKKGCLLLVKHLIEDAQATLNVCNLQGLTPLQEAMKNFQWHVVQYFMDYNELQQTSKSSIGTQPNHLFLNFHSSFVNVHKRYNFFRLAVEDNNIDIVRRLLSAEESRDQIVAAHNSLRRSIIHCIWHHRVEMLDILLNQGHIECDSGIIVEACLCGNSQVLQLVLPHLPASKADKPLFRWSDSKSQFRISDSTHPVHTHRGYRIPRSPVEWCVRNYRWKEAQLLIQAGYSANTRTFCPPLCYAITQQRYDMFHFLIDEAGALTHHYQLSKGDILWVHAQPTPLLYALRVGHFDGYAMAKELINQYHAKLQGHDELIVMCRAGQVSLLQSVVERQPIGRNLCGILIESCCASAQLESARFVVETLGKSYIHPDVLAHLFYSKQHDMLQYLRKASCIEMHSAPSSESEGEDWPLLQLQDAIASYLFPCFNLRRSQHYYYSKQNPDLNPQFRDANLRDYHNRCYDCMKIAAEMGLAHSSAMVFVCSHINTPAFQCLVDISFPVNPRSMHEGSLPIDILLSQKENHLAMRLFNAYGVSRMDLKKTRGGDNDSETESIGSLHSDYRSIFEPNYLTDDKRWCDDLEEPIHRLARSGDTEGLQELILLSNSNGTDTRSLVNRCTDYIDPVVSQLIHTKMNSLTSIKQGRTALHIASFYGHVKVVKLLLDNGANISSKTPCGKTSLQISLKERHLNVVHALLERNTTTILSEEESFHVIQMAILATHVDLLQCAMQSDTVQKSFSNSMVVQLVLQCTRAGSVESMKLLLAQFGSRAFLKRNTKQDLQDVLNARSDVDITSLHKVISFQQHLLTIAKRYFHTALHLFLSDIFIAGVFGTRTSSDHVETHSLYISSVPAHIQWCQKEAIQKLKPCIAESSVELRSKKTLPSDYTQSISDEEKLNDSERYLRIAQVVDLITPSDDGASGQENFESVDLNQPLRDEQHTDSEDLNKIVAYSLHFLFNGLYSTVHVASKPKDMLRRYSQLGELFDKKLHTIFENKKYLFSPQIVELLGISRILEYAEPTTTTTQSPESSLDIWSSIFLSDNYYSSDISAASDDFSTEDTLQQMLKSRFVSLAVIARFLHTHMVSDYFTSDAVGVAAAARSEIFNLAPQLRVFEGNKAFILACRNMRLDFQMYILDRFERGTALLDEERMVHAAFAFGCVVSLERLLKFLTQCNVKLTGQTATLKVSESLPQQLLVKMLKIIFRFEKQTGSRFSLNSTFLIDLCRNNFGEAVALIFDQYTCHSETLSSIRTMEYANNEPSTPSTFIDKQTYSQCILQALRINSVQLLRTLLSHKDTFSLDILSAFGTYEDYYSSVNMFLLEGALIFCTEDTLKEFYSHIAMGSYALALETNVFSENYELVRRCSESDLSWMYFSDAPRVIHMKDVHDQFAYFSTWKSPSSSSQYQYFTDDDMGEMDMDDLMSWIPQTKLPMLVDALMEKRISSPQGWTRLLCTSVYRSLPELVSKIQQCAQAINTPAMCTLINASGLHGDKKVAEILVNKPPLLNDVSVDPYPCLLGLNLHFQPIKMLFHRANLDHLREWFAHGMVSSTQYMSVYRLAILKRSKEMLEYLFDKIPIASLSVRNQIKICKAAIQGGDCSIAKQICIHTKLNVGNLSSQTWLPEIYLPPLVDVVLPQFSDDEIEEMVRSMKHVSCVMMDRLLVRCDVLMMHIMPTLSLEVVDQCWPVYMHEITSRRISLNDSGEHWRHDILSSEDILTILNKMTLAACRYKRVEIILHLLNRNMFQFSAVSQDEQRSIFMEFMKTLNGCTMDATAASFLIEEAIKSPHGTDMLRFENSKHESIWSFITLERSSLPLIRQMLRAPKVDKRVLVVMVCFFRELSTSLDTCSIDYEDTYEAQICQFTFRFLRPSNLLEVALGNLNQHAVKHLVEHNYKHHVNLAWCSSHRSAILSKQAELTRQAVSHYASQWPDCKYISIPVKWDWTTTQFSQTLYSNTFEYAGGQSSIEFSASQDSPLMQQLWVSSTCIHKCSGLYKFPLRLEMENLSTRLLHVGLLQWNDQDPNKLVKFYMPDATRFLYTIPLKRRASSLSITSQYTLRVDTFRDEVSLSVGEFGDIVGIISRGFTDIHYPLRVILFLSTNEYPAMQATLLSMMRERQVFVNAADTHVRHGGWVKSVGASQDLTRCLGERRQFAGEKFVDCEVVCQK